MSSLPISKKGKTVTEVIEETVKMSGDILLSRFYQDKTIKTKGPKDIVTDVDIEIDMKPEDYKNQTDPQLDRAILEVSKELKKNPVKKPSLSKNRPNLKLPK